MDGVCKLAWSSFRHVLGLLFAQFGVWSDNMNASLKIWIQWTTQLITRNRADPSMPAHVQARCVCFSMLYIRKEVDYSHADKDARVEMNWGTKQNGERHEYYSLIRLIGCGSTIFFLPYSFYDILNAHSTHGRTAAHAHTRPNSIQNGNKLNRRQTRIRNKEK